MQLQSAQIHRFFHTVQYNAAMSGREYVFVPNLKKKQARGHLQTFSSAVPWISSHLPLSAGVTVTTAPTFCRLNWLTGSDTLLTVRSASLRSVKVTTCQ